MKIFLRLAAIILIPAKLYACDFSSSPWEDATTYETDSGNCAEIWRTIDSSGFYESNPTYIDRTDDTDSWSFSDPEDQGMDTSVLDSGLDHLSKNSTIFSALIIRNNTIVRERFYNNSAVNHSNNIHSSSKSMFPALMAIALDQGYINSFDQKIMDFFPEYASSFTGSKQNITVYDLLIMSSGFEWTEDETEYEIEGEDDWVKAILDLDLEFEPGEEFKYCSGNTHLLSAILTKATGMSTCEFAHTYLFKPLGIDAEHWGRDPQGVFSGGYNLYMRPREMARYALLYLNDGQYNGKQIIPSWIVTESREEVWNENDVEDDYGYGELWWLTTIDGYDSLIGWGYGGQFMLIIPDLNIVTIITQDTKEIDNEIDSAAFMKNYLIPSVQ
jgi:CubicO group peptidase (beta-lactamase class C family)